MSLHPTLVCRLHQTSPRKCLTVCLPYLRLCYVLPGPFHLADCTGDFARQPPTWPLQAPAVAATSRSAASADTHSAGRRVKCGRNAQARFCLLHHTASPSSLGVATSVTVAVIRRASRLNPLVPRHGTVLSPTAGGWSASTQGTRQRPWSRPPTSATRPSGSPVQHGCDLHGQQQPAMAPALHAWPCLWCLWPTHLACEAH